MAPALMERIDALLYWGTVLAYAVAGIAYVLAVVFASKGLARWAVRLVAVALAVNSAQLAFHWYRSGHAPYMTRIEVVSSTVWVAVAAFLGTRRWLPELQGAGAFILPFCTLAMGWVGTDATMTVTARPMTFDSTWLGIHVLFTQFFVVCALLAAGLAFVNLTGLAERKGRPVFKVAQGAVADDLICRFTAAAFIFLTVMIISGAIWGNHAWGRYWGWDSIEVWSLICWLIYALELHLIRTFGLRERKLHWTALVTLGVALFSIFGVVLVFPSIHGSYMIR